jgi:hypothetical protein
MLLLFAMMEQEQEVDPHLWTAGVVEHAHLVPAQELGGA